jgi:hypothetical protein
MPEVGERDHLLRRSSPDRVERPSACLTIETVDHIAVSGDPGRVSFVVMPCFLVDADAAAHAVVARTLGGHRR